MIRNDPELIQSLKEDIESCEKNIQIMIEYISDESICDQHKTALEIILSVDRDQKQLFQELLVSEFLDLAIIGKIMQNMRIIHAMCQQVNLPESRDSDK